MIVNMLLRNSTFETNSSSSHSLTYVDTPMNDDELQHEISKILNGNQIIIDFAKGTECWYSDGRNNFSDLPFKLGYLFSNLLHLGARGISVLNEFCEWLCDITGASQISITNSNSDDKPYLIFDKNIMLKINCFIYGNECYCTDNIFLEIGTQYDIQYDIENKCYSNYLEIDNNNVFPDLTRLDECVISTDGLKTYWHSLDVIADFDLDYLFEFKLKNTSDIKSHHKLWKNFLFNKSSINIISC